MPSVPTRKLNDGNEIPVLAYGFGTAHFMGKDEDITKAAAMALEHEYYHLDCAECYMNEGGVGAGIRASGVPRSKLFVTTKITGTVDQLDDVAGALDSSLQKLGLDYVDLYLLHVPFSAGSAEGEQKIWAQMEALQAAGKAKSIGVSNFQVSDLESLLKTAKVVPAINQIEFHPYHQQRDVVAFCRERGIAVSAYSSLRALTGARPGPADEVYASLAEKYGVTESDIGLRWCLDQDILVITTSKNSQRLKGFMNGMLGFKLDPSDVEKITEAGRGKSFQTQGMAYMSRVYGNWQTGQKAPQK